MREILTQGGRVHTKPGKPGSEEGDLTTIVGSNWSEKARDRYRWKELKETYVPKFDKQ